MPDKRLFIKEERLIIKEERLIATKLVAESWVVL